LFVHVLTKCIRGSYSICFPRLPEIVSIGASEFACKPVVLVAAACLLDYLLLNYIPKIPDPCSCGGLGGNSPSKQVSPAIGGTPIGIGSPNSGRGGFLHTS